MTSSSLSSVTVNSASACAAVTITLVVAFIAVIAMSRVAYA